MFVSDFRKEFYDVVQNQVIRSLGPIFIFFREEGIKGICCVKAVRACLHPSYSLSSSLPAEGPSLCGLRRGCFVRLQDPSGESQGPGRVLV